MNNVALSYFISKFIFHILIGSVIEAIKFILKLYKNVTFYHLREDELLRF